MSPALILTVVLKREEERSRTTEEIASLWSKFGREVRVQRKAQAIGLSDFAHQMGCSATMCAYLETGERDWSEEMARKAVEILGGK